MQQDATIRCLLLTSVSTCFGHHYAHLHENKGPVTAFGVLFWFCWVWLLAVVGRCLVGCEHYSAHILQDNEKFQRHDLDFFNMNLYWSVKYNNQLDIHKWRRVPGSNSY